MAALMESTYFTCTLGEARRWKEKHPERTTFTNVIDLIDRQATDSAPQAALGFADIGEHNLDSQSEVLINCYGAWLTQYSDLLPHI